MSDTMADHEEVARAISDTLLQYYEQEPGITRLAVIISGTISSLEGPLASAGLGKAGALRMTRQIRLMVARELGGV